MKKFLFFLMMLVALIPAALQAQETITIGDGTSAYYMPLPGWYGWQYEVLVYTPDAAEALDGNFELTQIAFNVQSNSTTSGAQMTIWVKDVDADFALATSQTFAELITDATQVYTNTAFTSTSGWNTYELSETFTHQAGNALLVAVRGIGCGTSGGCSRQCYYTEAANMHWYKRQDSSDPGTSASGTVDNKRSNIQLTIQPTGGVTCPKPNTLTVSDVTANEAHLEWTDEEAMGNYMIQCKTASQSWDDDDIFVDNVSNTEFTLRDLLPNTSYNVRVASVCGDETSSWRSAFFSTSLVPVELPFICDFEDEEMNTFWAIENGTQTNKWFIGSAVNNTPDGANALYISNDNGTTNAYSHTASVVWAYVDVAFPEYSGFQFKFDWKADGESCCDYLRVFIGDPVAVAVGTNSVPTGATQIGQYNKKTSWQTVEEILPASLSNSTKRLWFMWRNDGSTGTNPPVAIDNISLIGLNCGRPENLRARNVDVHSANLQWSSRDDAFNVYFKVSSDSLFTLADISPVNDTFCTLDNLEEGTAYQVYVASVCDDNEIASSTISFNTMCEPVEITEEEPWFESFESYTHDGAGQEPFVCFDTPIQDATYHGPFVYCNYRRSCHTGVNSAELKGSTNMLVLPAFVNDIHTLRLSFWATATSTTVGNVVVGVVTDANDPSSFEPVGTTGRPGARGPEGTTVSGYGNFMGPFDFVGVQAESGRIALRYTSTSASASWNLDDFTVSLIPDCAAPVANSLTATEVTAHTATISWVDNDENHSNWMVYYKKKSDGNDDWQTEQATDTFAVLSGLDPETIYQAYVVTICGEEGTDTTQHVSFTTQIACHAPSNITVSNITTESATLTWSGDGQSYNVEYGPLGFVPGEGTEVVASDTTLDLTVEPSTMYMVYIVGDCGAEDGTSDTSSFRFTTPCELPLEELPYRENFNAYAGSTSAAPLSTYPNDETPLCWSFLNRSTSSSVYPQVFISSNSGYAVSGKCLFFRSSNTTPVYAILPSFAERIQGLQISFTYRNEGTTVYNGTLSVGYMTDIADTNSFVEVFSCPKITTLTEKVVRLDSIPEEVENATIAFKYTGGSGSNYFVSIDDVIVEEIATCSKPASLAVTGITATSVTLSWSSAGEDVEYEIAYGGVNFNPANAENIITTSDTLYEITDLNTGSKYEFYVRTNCGGNDVSGWRGPVAGAPGSYNMHVTGWDTLYTCGAIIYDDGGSEGDYSNNCDSYLVVYPEEEGLFVQINGTLIAEGPSYDYLTFYDGVGTDRLILKTNQTSSQLYTIPTVQSTTGPITIWFKSDSSVPKSGFELITSCVSCIPPTISAAATSSSDILVTMLSPVESWDLVYGVHGFQIEAGTNEDDIFDSTITISGLDANTQYDFYVRANCEDGESEWAGPFSVTTLCAAFVVTDDEPYVEYFNVTPGCWTFEGLNYNTSGYLYHSLSSATVDAITPMFDITGVTTPYLKFSEKRYKYSTTYNPETLRIYYRPSVESEWSVLAEYTDNCEAWRTESLPLIGASETYQIKFVLSNGYGYTYIDSVKVYNEEEPLNCVAPVGLTLGDITANSANVSWTNLLEGETLELYYKEHSDSVFTTVPASEFTDGNSYQMEGLEPATSYDVYVAALCDNDDTLATNILTFTTHCLTTVVTSEEPFMEDFNTLTAGIPECWDNSEGTTTSATYKWSYYSSGETGACVRFNSFSNPNGNTNMLKTPVLDLSALTAPMVSFSYKNPAGGDFSVFLSTDGGTTYTTPIVTGLTGIANWTEGNYVLPAMEDASSVVIVFKGTSNYGSSGAYLDLDNVYVGNVPTCPKPAGLSVTATTSESVTLSWTAGDEEEAWDIIYGAPGFDMEDGTILSNVTTNPYEVTGLDATTDYEFYVRANCGGGDVSVWINSVTASTNMVAVDLPYSTDFSAQDWKLNNGTCTNKWRIGVPADSTNAALYVTNDGSTAAYTVSSTSIVSAEKLFAMTNADSVNITFDVRVGGESSFDYLKVFLAPSNVQYEAATTAPTYAGNSYSTNAMNFQDYMSQTTGTQSYSYKLNLTQGRLHISLNMPNPDPNGYAKLVFVWKNDFSNGTQPGAIIENVSVMNATDTTPTPPTPVTCNAPTNVTANNITYNSAEIDWAQEGTPDSWTVNYKKASVQTWTTVNVNAHPYTITDLEAETSYDVYVTANCGDTTSAASNPISFTTLIDGVNEYVNSTVIYPNPTTGQFTISNTQCVIESVEVFDVYGKLLNTVEVNDNTAVIDVTNYTSGVYFTRVHTDKGIVTKRVVKK